MMWLRKYAGWLLGGVLGMLLCAACNPHEFPVSPEGDPGRDFSVRLQFADDMAVLRTVSGDTKAAGGANAWRYSVQLLRYRDDISFNLTTDYAYTFTRSERISALDTTVYLPIDPARYRVVAWVDRLDADGVPGYDISDFEYISVGEGYDLGKGTRDAFRGVKDLDLEGLVTAGPGDAQDDASRGPAPLHRPGGADLPVQHRGRPCGHDSCAEIHGRHPRGLQPPAGQDDGDHQGRLRHLHPPDEHRR